MRSAARRPNPKTVAERLPSVVVCAPVRRVYPKGGAEGFGVVLCRARRKIRAGGVSLRRFFAAGYYLPDSKGMRVEFRGVWHMGSLGLLFHVKQVKILSNVQENMNCSAWLDAARRLAPYGVPREHAERIARELGEQTLEAIERDPRAVCAAHGIPRAIAESIACRCRQPAR